MEDQDFLLFIKKVKEHTSIDLALYKEAQMKRRSNNSTDEAWL